MACIEMDVHTYEYIGPLYTTAYNTFHYNLILKFCLFIYSSSFKHSCRIIGFFEYVIYWSIIPEIKTTFRLSTLPERQDKHEHHAIAHIVCKPFIPLVS